MWYDMRSKSNRSWLTVDILQQKRLLKFGAVPFTTDVLEGVLGDYSAPIAKIAALAEEGRSLAKADPRLVPRARGER